MGNPIGVKGRKIQSVRFVYIGDVTSFEVTEAATLDENAGKVTIKVNKSLDLKRGAFYPTIALTGSDGVS